MNKYIEVKIVILNLPLVCALKQQLVIHSICLSYKTDYICLVFYTGILHQFACMYMYNSNIHTYCTDGIVFLFVIHAEGICSRFKIRISSDSKAARICVQLCGHSCCCFLFWLLCLLQHCIISGENDWWTGVWSSSILC